MNINTGLNPYNSNSYINNVDTGRINQSQSLTGSVTDALKQGDVFEGSVNSIENGKVTIGLGNGQTMTARLDSGVELVPGQSIFFEVKSNDGSLVQIRPVSLNGLEANPTLLKALDMANLAANERTINMVNSMMQNSMSINPENLATMNRAILSYPEVNPQTLIAMSKFNIDINPGNIAMFQNYTSDKAILGDNFQIISDMLPEAIASPEVPTAEVININNKIAELFIGKDAISQNAQLTEATPTNPEQVTAGVPADSPEASLKGSLMQEANVSNNGATNSANSVEILDNLVANKDVEVNIVKNGDVPEALQQNDILQNAASKEVIQSNSSELGAHTLNTVADEKQIASFNRLLNELPDFIKNNSEIFTKDGILNHQADVKTVFSELARYLNEHQDIPRESLNQLIKSPVYKGLLKNLITESFSIDPKDITKAGELSKLYEKVLKQTDQLERILSGIDNKATDAIKTQTNEVRQNINFMNSANEMYNFVQIPLKMYNQNTDSMLYVKQNKKSSYEAGEEITAFLHFDMEYLGSTDVFISMREAKVGCKWTLASEDSMKLIEDNLDILTERLAKKGFDLKSEVTCEKGEDAKNSFIQEFFNVPSASAPKEGIVHRYSFDMRA